MGVILLIEGLEIRHLIVSNTDLAVVEELSLTALWNKLELLDLPQNRITTIPSPALKHLKETRLLTLNHNNITNIGPKAFDGMKSLVRLYLYDNRIARIDPQAFVGLDR